MPLIQIQPYYRLGYAVVSLIFLVQIIGYGTMCFCGNILHKKMGRHKLLSLGGFLSSLGFSLICWAPPFPVMVIPLSFITNNRSW